MSNNSELLSKKVGEVLAFAAVETDTLKKGQKALESVWGREEFSACMERTTTLEEKLRSLLEVNPGMKDVAEQKAEKTGKKLKDMRELYLQDEWDDHIEIMEWMGFFEGAAIVHWRLVKGASQVAGIEELHGIAEHGIQFHNSMFEAAGNFLETSVGRFQR